MKNVCLGENCFCILKYCHKLIITIPYNVFLTLQVFFKDETIKQVNVPTINGVFGILPQHVPTLAVLQPGVVSVVVNDSETKNIFGKLVKEKNLISVGTESRNHCF